MRLPLALGLAALVSALVVLPAGGHKQAFPDRAPEGYEFLETVKVPPGSAPFVRSKTDFHPDVGYRFIISGAVTYNLKGDPPGRSYSVDAAWCYAATGGATCGEGPPRQKGAALIVNHIPLRVELREASYKPSRSYDLEADGLEGRATFHDGNYASNFVNFSGSGFTIDIYQEEGCDKPDARPAAINEVRVIKVRRATEWRPNEKAPWCRVVRNQVLQQGHELATNPDGQVTLAFADNSTVVIRRNTQIKIASFFTEGGVVRTELLLKNGELAADVPRSETTKSDFRVRPPAPVSSVRGTKFSVFYDPGSDAALYSVMEGEVEVGEGANQVILGAGQEVEAVGDKIGQPAAIGMAGARGGVNRATATSRVLSRIAKSKCNVSTPRSKATSTKPTKGGWKVKVQLTGKKVKGKSAWTVKGSKVKPVNRKARRVARDCR